MKKITYLLITLALISCVPKSEYENLKLEYTDLNTKYENLQYENEQLEKEITDFSEIKNSYENLIQEKIKLEKELANHRPKGNRLSQKTYSERQAIETVQDYFDFYDRDYVIRNIKVRRKSNSSFWVSYEKVNRKFSDNDFHYNSETKILDFFENDEYRLRYDWQR